MPIKELKRQYMQDWVLTLRCFMLYFTNNLLLSVEAHHKKWYLVALFLRDFLFRVDTLSQESLTRSLLDVVITFLANLSIILVNQADSIHVPLQAVAGDLVRL